MSRKSGNGYYVHGEFVPAGSDLDAQFKAELKGTAAASRTDLKRESEELQELGEALLGFGPDAFARLKLPGKLLEAVLEARRITARGGKRRQLQFIGKLMRQQDHGTIDAIRETLHMHHAVSARESAALHTAETWRDRLIADDGSLQHWLSEHPATDAQQLRALIRQARSDARTERPGDAQRHGRAYRGVFQLVRQQLSDSGQIS